MEINAQMLVAICSIITPICSGIAYIAGQNHRIGTLETKVDEILDLLTAKGLK